ncbi:MAG: hypothetical protein ACNA71_10340, partial [Kiritimatiellia bacterium]
EAVSDVTHISRLRQDPRGHAIRLLGSFGNQALGAVPVLEEILATEADGRWHKDARAAREAILGRSPE